MAHRNMLNKSSNQGFRAHKALHFSSLNVRIWSSWRGRELTQERSALPAAHPQLSSRGQTEIDTGTGKNTAYI